MVCPVSEGEGLMIGTPYLLSLGLSKAQLSLVWLAGPLSGVCGLRFT